MVNNSTAGYCGVCDVSVNNIHQHKKTKKHLQRVEKKEITGTNDIIYNSQPEEQPEEQPETKERETMNSIQIIDSNTNKQQKSTVTEIMEIAFSEQFAPITMSVITALTQRLTNEHNPAQEKGNLVKTQGGLEIEDF